MQALSYLLPPSKTGRKQAYAAHVLHPTSFAVLPQRQMQSWALGTTGYDFSGGAAVWDPASGRFYAAVTAQPTNGEQPRAEGPPATRLDGCIHNVPMLSTGALEQCTAVCLRLALIGVCILVCAYRLSGASGSVVGCAGSLLVITMYTLSARLAFDHRCAFDVLISRRSILYCP
jgi:hypothetical protein